MLLSIRDATVDDAAALAHCVIDPIVNTFSGRVPDRCLEWLTYAESEANWRRSLGDGWDEGWFLLVAELPDSGVVGCALAGPAPDDPRFDAELKLLGVLPREQGRGTGKALVVETAARLRGQGSHSLGVRVLAANPNTAFYEHLGARYLDSEPYDWNGVALEMLVYWWPDMAPLTGDRPGR